MGLLFDKFCNRWSATGELKEAKHDFLKEEVLADYKRGHEMLEGLLESWITRRKVLVERLGGKTETFTTTSRLVTGLGMNHVLENGFVWHPTLSVPYLPGSGVKGMVRAWVDPGKGWSDGSDGKTARRLFGGGNAGGDDDLDEGDDLGVGTLVVFDALPAKVPLLWIDIMNVHHQTYYQKGQAPSDYEKPILVYFLVVDAGVDFEFAIAPRPGVGTSADVDEGFTLLKHGTEILGFGAKTATGYGRFERVADSAGKGGR